MSRRFLPLLALIPVFISAYALSEAWFGALALLGYLVGCGRAFGTRLTPRLSSPLQIAIGAMATVASMSILGSLVYYGATVTTESLLLALVIISGLACFAYVPSQLQPRLQTYRSIDIAVFTVGCLSLLGWWIAVLSLNIQEPTRSIWLALDPFSLIALGLAVGCTIALFVQNRGSHLTTFLFAFTLFSATSAAAITYDLGYGFDPFLHRATVSHIAEHGTITPKPLYYIGQYALELIGIKIFALPLFALDTLLAPILASFGIVAALASRQASLKESNTILVSLIFLPLAAFIQTTPQALAFIFTAWTLFAGTRPRLMPALFALAAIVTHPLAGIGAVMYVFLLVLDDIPDHHKTWRTASIALTTIVAAVAIPIAFTLQAKLAHLTLNFTPANLVQLWKLPIETFFTTQYSAWGDTAYFFLGNAFVTVLGLAIIGIFLTPKQTYGWYVPGLVALSMFINFIILSLGFDFTFLIAYERLDFALRLLTLTTLFLLPYVAVLLSFVWKKLLVSPVGLRVGFTVLLSIFFVTNVYAAYPRHDNYARSAGFNVGPSDFDAVRAIEKHAQGQEYIVLSSQALAAAAVQELGFKQYYHGDIFFYPIPTGGPLYQEYLAMVEDRPTAETMTAAMDLAGVDLAYFAVHNYWWQAPQIVENTKAITDDWFAVGDGDVTVFIFKR